MWSRHRRRWLAALALVLGGAAVAAAQDPTASPGVIPAVHVTINTTAIIAILVPALIALLKQLLPMIPPVWLPIIAPILGMAIDLIDTLVTGSKLNPMIGAAWGMAGVGLREIVDQLRKARQRPPEPLP